LARWFTGVRRDGFLACLGPEAWHTLSALLSFTRRDGGRRFTLDQFATVISQPRDEAARRLQALADTYWKGEPLAVLALDPAGQVREVALAPIERLAVIDPEPASSGAHVVATSLLPGGLTNQLVAVGLNPSQIDMLGRRFPEAAIRRQLEWLPARGARNPAALLIRAIEQDWDEPKGGV